jgi:5'-nucleotidase
VTYTVSSATRAAIVGKPCAGAANPVTDLRIDGAPVVAGTSYRITVNNFLADGGDGFSVLKNGTARTGGAVDLDALVAYLKPSVTGTPQAVPALDRIDLVP